MAYIGNAPADQALEIGTGVVGTTEIEDLSILNADVSASAALVFSKMANLTVGRALISDGSGDVSVSDVTSTEVGYLDGVSSALQTQLGAKAALASPTFTGNPIAPTQSAGNNSTRIATTAYADTAAANLVDSAPATLNTLNELAAALGDDANFSTTVTNSIATKLPIAGGTAMTGTLTVGANTDGHDVTFYGNGSGKKMVWDESADKLIVTGAIETADLILNNNRGHYTIVEEEDYLSIRNELTGKKYKFVLEEIDE